VTRAEVIDHCEHYNLPFRADSSNFDPNFTRNRIRHTLLPLLRDFNPRLGETLSRTAELLSQDDACLSSLAAESFRSAVENSNLDISSLLHAVPAIRRRVLRLWLKTQRGDLRRIEMSHIDAIDRLTAPGQSGRLVELPGGAVIAREFNLLKFIPKKNFTHELFLRLKPIDSAKLLETIKLKEENSIEFGDFRFTLRRGIATNNWEFNHGDNPELFTAVLRECEELGEIGLRTRVPGDAYIPANTTRAVKLKTLMIRRKIPLSKRDKYPVLVTPDGFRIIWAPGLPVAREFAPNASNAPNIPGMPSLAEEPCVLVMAEKLR
jgi:tRNA(Ile)-lysidine synthase